MDDRSLFASTLDFYQAILDEVTSRVADLGFHPTSRVKTTGTLTEKLRREHGIQLTRINDIAGLRIVINGGRKSQDQTVATLVSEFSDERKRPQVIDRRHDPRQGYRAVHIVVFRDNFPVEIQVRTQLQDSWAQIFERIADRWGRQIRYGGEVDEPGTEVTIRGDYLQDRIRRSQVIELLQALSRSIASYEEEQFNDEILEAGLGGLSQEVIPSITHHVSIGVDYSDFLPEQSEYREVRDGIVSICRKKIKDRRKRNRLIRRSFPKARRDLSITRWARGLNTLASAVHSELVESRPERRKHRDFIVTMLNDLSKLDEEETAS